MIHPPEFRNRVLADYHQSGDRPATVARRHNMQPSTLRNWIGNDVDDLALTGGRWVNCRGVMRWEWDY